MAQFGWVYLNNGNRHRVGLYHGDDTGHLVIHCNMRVVQIDFSVKETTTYSFMIDDELCEVLLFKEPDGRFTYDFKVNTTANTPGNQVRRIVARQNRRYMWVLVSGLVLLLAGVLVGVSKWRHHVAAERLAERGFGNALTDSNVKRLQSEGQTAVATLMVVKMSLTRQIVYTFTTRDSQRVACQVIAPDTGDIRLPTGFALADRDQFSLRYLPSNPQVSQVDFQQPQPGTLARYLVLASQSEQQAHPGETREQALCVAKTLYEQRGLGALADAFHQTTEPTPDGKHDRESYQKLLRDSEVALALKQQCWGSQ